MYPLIQDPKLRAVFSEVSTPGIVWEEIEANPQLVFINGKGITDPASRSFAMQWVLENLFSHLKGRGRRTTPFVVTIDEFANLVNTGTADNKPLAELFDELFAQDARNNRIFVTTAFQSLDQVDQRLQQTLLWVGTIISGRAGSAREARQIADRLFRKDIFRIHHHKKVFGKVDPVPLIRGVGYVPAESLSVDKLSSPYYPYYILDYDPQYMGLDLQAEDTAGRIQQLGALEFLCRPAIRDTVIPFSLHPAISDPDTGELQFPDPDQDHPLIAQIQQQLAARSGIPVTDILTEQERKSDFQTRLRQGTPQNPQQVQATTDAEGRQPPQLPDGTQPEPRSVWETQSRPTLNNDHVELLTYLMEHPDEPVSVVYKQVGMRAAAITTIRRELAAQGLLSELEVRTGSTTGGRPVKFLLPTTQAWELVGIEPPAGRGGAIHKHVQRMVVQGALAKGYSAVVEHADGTGIVDVYLEKPGRQIAVEIAIASKTEREIAHIKHCLVAGYDQIYCVIADDLLRERIATAIRDAFSAQEAGKVRLLPLRMLSQVGSDPQS